MSDLEKELVNKRKSKTHNAKANTFQFVFNGMLLLVCRLFQGKMQMFE